MFYRILVFKNPWVVVFCKEDPDIIRRWLSEDIYTVHFQLGIVKSSEVLMNWLQNDSIKKSDGSAVYSMITHRDFSHMEIIALYR